MLNVVKALVITGTAILAVVSCASNAIFWSQFGRGEIERYVLGGGSVAIDLIKVSLPVLIAVDVAARHWFRAGIGVLVFCVFFAAGVAGAAGFIAMQRAAHAGERDAGASKLKAAEAEQRSLETRLAAITVAAPVAVLAADLEARRNNPLWSRSKQCADATAQDSRQFCADYARASGQHAAAVEAAGLRASLATVSATVSELKGAGAAQSGDAQADMIARALSISKATASDVAAAFLAGLIEVGAALGLYLAGVSHAPRRNSEPVQVVPPVQEVEPVALVAAERVEIAPPVTRPARITRQRQRRTVVSRRIDAAPVGTVSDDELQMIQRTLAKL